MFRKRRNEEENDFLLRRIGRRDKKFISKKQDDFDIVFCQEGGKEC